MILVNALPELIFYYDLFTLKGKTKGTYLVLIRAKQLYYPHHHTFTDNVLLSEQADEYFKGNVWPYFERSMCSTGGGLLSQQ